MDSIHRKEKVTQATTPVHYETYSAHNGLTTSCVKTDPETSQIRPTFDSHSTAVRPHYDHSRNCVIEYTLNGTVRIEDMGYFSVNITQIVYH